MPLAPRLDSELRAVCRVAFSQHSTSFASNALDRSRTFFSLSRRRRRTAGRRGAVCPVGRRHDHHNSLGGSTIVAARNEPNDGRPPDDERAGRSSRRARTTSRDCRRVPRDDDPQCDCLNAAPPNSRRLQKYAPPSLSLGLFRRTCEPVRAFRDQRITTMWWIL